MAIMLLFEESSGAQEAKVIASSADNTTVEIQLEFLAVVIVLRHLNITSSPSSFVYR